MSRNDPAWAEHQRRWLRPDWQRWMRHDAHLFAPPGANAPKTYASRLMERLKAEEEDAAREIEHKAFQAELLELRRQLVDLKFELAWRRISHKYDPNQPRVPKGDPKGGQWAKEGGGDAGKEPASDGPSDTGEAPSGVILSDASPDPIRPGAQYAQSRIEINPEALTGIETIDNTTIALTKRLANVVDALEDLPIQSGPIYGHVVHEALKWSLRAFPIPGVKVEPTFGGTGKYGSDGSVRPDISLENAVGDKLAHYDYKTGGATVRPSYADKVRRLGGGPWVPVIQLSVTRGVKIKSQKHPLFDR